MGARPHEPVGVSAPLRDRSERQRKFARLDEPHVAPLTGLVRRWRETQPHRAVPWFDPDDGGVGATVLILMEAPGPRTVAAGDLGFCSEDNDDATAAVLRRERERSGLRRSSYLRWNIVPWQLVDDEQRWRAPRPADLDEAMSPLTELLEWLPDLRLTITVGRPALHGWTSHQTLFSDRLLPVLAVPHPSQRNTAGGEESLRRLRFALRAAARLADGNPL